jgi:hypothetical protein
MHRTIQATGKLSLLFALALAAHAQDAGPNAGGARVLGTHQIDRFAAIEQTRAALEADPNNLNDWIILGELAQEVAGDVPTNLAAGYFKLAHDSYEAALKLSPGNASLQAAARFAREQEQDAEAFAQGRRRAAATYLKTRRDELAQHGAAPTVRVHSYPNRTQTRNPAAAAAPSYYYQPYAASDGSPYTYQQHYRNYSFPEDDGIPAQPRAGQVLTATERAALVKPAAKFAPP